MKKSGLTLILIFIVSIIISTNVYGQTQTMGVFINDTSQVYDGYTLFAPKQNTMTYLIDNDGHKLHEWSASAYPPGQSVYLLENGHLLRTCMTQGNLGTGGGEGGRIEEYDWNDNLLWFMNYSTSTYMQHHDIKKLPNGNIIMLVVEKKTLAEVEAAGFDTSNFQPDVQQHGFILPDCIIEVQPTYPSGGTVVWSWHVWDHLIQNHDATKLNYGVPSQHPELIDCAGDHRKLPLFWNHMNAIDYNSSLDQIVVSVRGNSELWIVDHNTTLSESASHTGGAHNKGGDLLYRWGNPQCYGIGNNSNETYFEQHDVEWIKSDCPGAGDLMCFNNGVNRNFSSIDEITPPIDGNGNYTYVSGTAYGPTGLTWTYQANPPTSMYASDISGTQRLPNGNTIIDVGPVGTFYEVTPSGQVVWKYISPVTDTGPLMQGDSIPHNYPIHPNETMNSVFRIYKYAKTYAGFSGQTIVPGNFIEITGTNEMSVSSKMKVYPNPFSGKINVMSTTGNESYKLINVLGETVWSGSQIGNHDFSNINKGIYILKVNISNATYTIKVVKE